MDFEIPDGLRDGPRESWHRLSFPKTPSGPRPDAEIDKPSEEEQGFFRGMRRIFGFSEDENDE